MEDRLQNHVRKLAFAPRVPGTSEHEKARAYVREQFQQAGFSCRESVHEVHGVSCINLLTEPLPQNGTGPVVIVGAHYDTVPDSPGADDNGSALAVLIELAHALGPKLQSSSEVNAQLQLVAYDHEETGKLGSSAHADQVVRARTEIRGMIALEMLGYASDEPSSQQLPPPLMGLYPDVANFIAVLGDHHSVDLLEQVSDAMRSIAELPVEQLAIPEGSPLLQEAGRSDHEPFWAHGIAALMITDTSNFRNPHYHQSSDTPETLNYRFLAKVALGVQEAVWRLLVSETSPLENPT